MHTRTSSEQSGKWQDIIHTSILLTIALCVGAYLIGTTILIAKDGVTFIEYAKNLTKSGMNTILSQDQHPGYPFLIFIAHRTAEVAYEGSSLWSWIYSAQVAALIFRSLAVAALYFVGKEVVGPRFSFLAIIILTMLPKPAKYGSDALSDWPHLFFLAIGFLLLIRGAKGGKWWLFGFVGIVAGMGYLIRPECAQLVVFGSLWLVPQLFLSKRTVSKHKVVFALALLFVGFLVTAGPYMKLKGAIFPKKGIGWFASDFNHGQVHQKQDQSSSNTVGTAAFMPPRIAAAFGKLAEKISETLMWFFVPALLIGLYKYFGTRNWHKPEKFLITVFIAFNITLMVWLHCKHGYMSGRHVLPLVTFTIFYVPDGLQALAVRLQERFSKGIKTLPAVKSQTSSWFFVLFVIGISICIPKLLKPLHHDKLVFHKAAQWLSKNTEKTDLIAVPDPRISFYAGRRGIRYQGRTMPSQAQYIVKVIKNKKDSQPEKETAEGKKLFSVEDDKRKYKVNIYGKFGP